MANNELSVGEPRLGWLFDDNPETPHIAAMIRDTGTAIELTIPLRGLFASDDPYSRWWSSGIDFGDDPDRTRYSYEPPRVLAVEDNEGAVVLVGCRATGWKSNFHHGQGRIVANYAVLGGRNLKYEKIHGLRTEIPALAAWTRLSSMKHSVTTDEKNRVQAVKMVLTDAPPIPLARPMNLTMQSSWTTKNKPAGSFRAEEGVKIESSVRRARTWDEHQQLHNAVLDLVSLAAWRPFGYSTIEVLRRDDPESSLGGTDMGERWLSVVTHRLPKHEEWSREPHFLFPYSEVGPRGIARWIRLRNEYSQVVVPLLSILRSDHPWSDASVVQSGIALEALGYLIDLNKHGGAHLNSRQQLDFATATREILSDLDGQPFPDTHDWADRAKAVHMAAKHPDRQSADSLVVLNTLRESVLILRWWIALQLGVSEHSLSNRLPMDRLANEFVPVE